MVNPEFFLILVLRFWLLSRRAILRYLFRYSEYKERCSATEDIGGGNIYRGLGARFRSDCPPPAGYFCAIRLFPGVLSRFPLAASPFKFCNSMVWLIWSEGGHLPQTMPPLVRISLTVSYIGKANLVRPPPLSISLCGSVIIAPFGRSLAYALRWGPCSRCRGRCGFRGRERRDYVSFSSHVYKWPYRTGPLSKGFPGRV